MLRAIRITATVIIPVLLAAWVILFLFPTRTGQLWAWAINPPMTAITMGSGYLGGAWFFFRVAMGGQTHRIAGGLLAATVFVTLLGLTTTIHWDRFDHGHVSFWAWGFLYFTSPLFLPFFFRASRRASVPDPGDATVRRVPRLGVAGMVMVGITQLVAAATWFVAPRLAIDNWPWSLSPLTARTIASFVAFCGVLLLWVLVDRRYSAVQVPIEAVVIGLVAISAGALFAREDFTGPRYAVVLYVLALIAMLGLFGSILIGSRAAPAAPVGEPSLPTPPAPAGNGRAP